MKMQHHKSITLKNLLINEEKQIGIQFQPDKVIQALLKELPGIKWSDGHICKPEKIKENGTQERGR